MKEQIITSGQGRLSRSIKTTAATFVSLALLAGCGGGGGGGGAPAGGGAKAISGDNLEFASVAADLKAAAAGSVGPFAILGSIQANAGAMIAHRTPSTPKFIDFLGLYQTVVVSSTKLTMNYSTVADGKSGAGQIVVTTTDLKTFHGAGSITGGSLPMTMNVTVVLQDTAGANTMNGNVTLTGQQISFTMKNLAANDQGTIVGTGEMDVVLTGLSTTTFTSLTGKATGDIYGNVSVTALGQTFTGTGTLDLLDGTVQLSIKGPNDPDPITAYMIGKLNSQISFTDGKSLNVNDLLDFNLSKLTGSSGGLPTGSGGTGFQAPVAINVPSGTSSTLVWQALSNGQMVGQTIVGSSKSEALYWDSPTAAATPLPVPVGVIASAAYGIANTGSKRIAVGSYEFSDGFVHACMWTSSSKSGATNFDAPTVFPIDQTLYAIGGVARAISANGTYVVGAVVKNGADVPVEFTSGRVFELPLGGLSGAPAEAIGVSTNGTVLGAQNLQYNPVVWLNVKISGSTITASQQNLLNTKGSNIPPTEAFHISSNGTVAGAEGDGKALYWDNTGYQASILNAPSGDPAAAYAVSDDGTKFAGLLNVNSGIDMSYWASASATAVDVSATLPSSGYSGLSGDFLLSDGSIVALGEKTGTTSVVFTYVKKG